MHSIEAARILEADLLTDPDDARLHSSLALTYAGLGRKEEALRNHAGFLDLVERHARGAT